MNEEFEYKSDFFQKFNLSAKEQRRIKALMLLAAKIQNGIKAKGWNKSEFAEALEISNRSIISKWLSGTNNFQVDTLLEIGDVLGIDLLNLEFDSSDKSIGAIVPTSVTINVFREMEEDEISNLSDLAVSSSQGIQIFESDVNECFN